MTVFAHPGHLCASKVDRLWRKEAKDRCMMRCVVPVQRAVQHTTQRCNLRRFVLAGKKNLGTFQKGQPWSPQNTKITVNCNVA